MFVKFFQLLQPRFQGIFRRTFTCLNTQVHLVFRRVWDGVTTKEDIWTGCSRERERKKNLVEDCLVG